MTRQPQTGQEAREYIQRLESECRSRAARERMAYNAVHGCGAYRANHTPEARAIWSEYLATFQRASP